VRELCGKFGGSCEPLLSSGRMEIPWRYLAFHSAPSTKHLQQDRHDLQWRRETPRARACTSRPTREIVCASPDLSGKESLPLRPREEVHQLRLPFRRRPARTFRNLRRAVPQFSRQEGRVQLDLGDGSEHHAEVVGFKLPPLGCVRSARGDPSNTGPSPAWELNNASRQQHSLFAADLSALGVGRTEVVLSMKMIPS
jgi:hypothetical protein